VNLLEEWMKGYIAGIIDGEGTIRLKYMADRDLYYPEVIISNSNFILCEAVKYMLGVESKIISQVTNAKGVDWKGRPITQRKPIYRLCVSNRREIYELLEQIESYLMIKREQALLIMEFITIRENLETRCGCNYGERSPREREIFEKMKELNRR
jgi:hypothetical protein